jgi:acetoin utilization deacetylase AcuC-like enzyme
MLLYASDWFEKHDTGSHPECIARISNVNRMLQERGWNAACHRPAWMAASADRCHLNHSPEYIEQLHDWSVQGAGRVEADTVVSTGTWDAAMLGVGALCDAIDRIARGEDSSAFCAIRPPGHHALRDAPMGFCVVNNIAVAAKRAQAVGFERVLIVDWDVHHGNGTQASFWTDPSVGFLSIHRFPFYPGTGREDERGEGKGEGFTVNIPVAADTSAQEFLNRMIDATEPFADRLRPQLILLSAGFDAHVADPVGGLTLESEHYEQAGQWIADLAKRHCAGRLVSVLEGGYHLQHMPESVDAHLRGINHLMQGPPAKDKSKPKR